MHRFLSDQCLSGIMTAVEHDDAISCSGYRLIHMKQSTKHGEWTRWISWWRVRNVSLKEDESIETGVIVLGLFFMVDAYHDRWHSECTFDASQEEARPNDSGPGM